MAINRGFNRASYNNIQENISIEALRIQTQQRLSGVQARLQAQGVGAVFINEAKRDPIGDIGPLGGLIVGSLLFGAMASHLGVQDMSFTFNGAAVPVTSLSALTEAAVLVYDDESKKPVGTKKRRILGDYPEGRRACALTAAKARRKFNLVSANQNERMSRSVESELGCMYEILDMLDCLERAGMATVPVSDDESVYDTLSALVAKARSAGPVRARPAPAARAAA